jgi:hypothetical protein
MLTTKGANVAQAGMRMRVALRIACFLLFVASTVRAEDTTSLEVEGPMEGAELELR